MKALAVALSILIPYCSYPQGVFTNDTHSTLQKVISDYPRFSNIKGQLISEGPQTTDYSSIVQVPGCLSAIITRYSSEEDEEIYSWKCVLLSTEDFQEATVKYDEFFKQISNSIIRIDGQKPFILNGSYIAPTEEKRFNSSAFHLVPATAGDLKKLKVELTLEFLVTEWKLSLLVYDHTEENQLAMD